jgi:hypothetical protein
VICDVREDLRNGREPFAKIMAAVSSLGPADELELLAIFEPVPLYGVLGKRGFDHRTAQLPGGDWKITFVRRAQPSTC